MRTTLLLSTAFLFSASYVMGEGNRFDFASKAEQSEKESIQSAVDESFSTTKNHISSGARIIDPVLEKYFTNAKFYKIELSVTSEPKGGISNTASIPIRAAVVAGNTGIVITDDLSSAGKSFSHLLSLGNPLVESDDAAKDMGKIFGTLYAPSLLAKDGVKGALNAGILTISVARESGTATEFKFVKRPQQSSGVRWESVE